MSSSHFADRLCDAILAKQTPLCVGFDPRWDMLPLALRQGTDLGQITQSVGKFCSQALSLVAPLVPVVKFNMAFFEVLGPEGLALLQSLLQKSHALHLVTILDGKRNDIAATAIAYAEAALGGTFIGDRCYPPPWEADALTVNPYLGGDAVEPFLVTARHPRDPLRNTGGVFVLVRTSNPGADRYQSLVCQGRPLFHHVAADVNTWTCDNLGTYGFGDVGAVVGATKPQDLAALRQLMPASFFLIPGFGYQGGQPQDLKPAFGGDGLGALVNSSRAVLFPFAPHEVYWEDRIVEATQQAFESLQEACVLR
jgi:orotidine-5'-phosphate decarboxylase